MTDKVPAEDRDLPRSADIDWESPRWREDDEIQGDVERGSRYRGDAAPNQRGAVDAGGSVGRGDDAPDASTPPAEPPAVRRRLRRFRANDAKRGGPADGTPGASPADNR